MRLGTICAHACMPVTLFSAFHGRGARGSERMHASKPHLARVGAVVRVRVVALRRHVAAQAIGVEQEDGADLADVDDVLPVRDAGDPSGPLVQVHVAQVVLVGGCEVIGHVQVGRQALRQPLRGDLRAHGGIGGWQKPAFHAACGANTRRMPRA